MSGTRILPALVVLALSLSLATGAEARKWRWWYSYGGHGASSRSDDDGRRARAEWLNERGKGGGAFGAVVDRLVRGCLQQADELRSWPFDDISRIAAPDDTQRAALEALRTSSAAAAERLVADCPQDVPAPPWARLEAVEQAIDAATAAFAAVEPALQAFYAALDDEQKARLLRDLTLAPAQPRAEGRRAERWEERRYRRRGDTPAGRNAPANGWAGICEHLTAALRGWPIREIERGVRLSEPQRVAFYELVTSSLRAADALAGACPAETALTPPARMALMRARLAAVRSATATIRPALVELYDALDHGQKVRFAGMS
jgi:LTXXQ motif family protein